MKITRREFFWKLTNCLLLFLFFSNKKAMAESNDILLAQSITDLFLVVFPDNGIKHPRDFREGSKICGSQRGLQFLQENFKMPPNITFAPIPLADLTVAMQHGICQAGVLLGNGSYTAEELEQRLFRYSGLQVIQVVP